MKRLILVALSMAMIFGVCACESSEDTMVQEESSVSDETLSYESEDDYDYKPSYEFEDDYDYEPSYESEVNYDYEPSYDSEEGYGYDPDDPYYSKNDHDGDGKITEEEFQDAMNDAIDDLYFQMMEMEDY